MRLQAEFAALHPLWMTGSEPCGLRSVLVTATRESTNCPEVARSPPLLMTKLHAPPAREQAIPRERLLERLQPSPGVKLTVLAAPFGFS